MEKVKDDELKKLAGLYKQLSVPRRIMLLTSAHTLFMVQQMEAREQGTSLVGSAETGRRQK